MGKQTFPHTNYDCGCQFVPRDDSWAIWTLCPLHETAPELLAACKVARECLLNGNPPAAPLLAIETAIAKTERGN